MRAPFGEGGSSDADAECNAFRRENLAVMPAVGAVLPDRCVVCNAPAEGFGLRKSFRWQEPDPAPLVFVGVWILSHTRGTVAFGLCPRHRARRRNGFLIAVAGAVVGLGMIVAGANGSSPEANLVLSGGALVTMLLLVVGVRMARVAYQVKIDHEHIWLKVGQPFLDGLPVEQIEPPKKKPRLQEP